MGVMLSVLLSYVGAIELVFIVRDLTHQLALHQMRLKNEQRKQSDISILQGNIKASINALETVETESVEQMQDGVLYKDGYRIDNKHSVEVVAQQWDERRKVMCTQSPSTSESPPPSIISSNGCTENGIQNKRTNNTNLNEYEKPTGNDDSLNDNEPNEQNNYRPIVRDDRSGRRKAFKKRHSSSSQSSDSIRLSREEELQMFTSLEEEEGKNNSFTPISYSNESLGKSSNSRRNVDPSFQEKLKNSDDPWGDVKPNSFHDSELWKRERATSIVEEREENSSTTNRISSDKLNRTGGSGTADKPTRKTSCENDKYASELDACEVIEHGDNYGVATLKEKDEGEVGNQNRWSTDPTEKVTIDIPYDVERDTDPTKSRDVRSTTVRSRSHSENSNIYQKSISRDSSSTCNESNLGVDRLGQRYSRTDSSNSFIQDEVDSEEYHHNYRFSMTADTLEYIRGRDDWRLHTENTFNNLYSRQSSNISIREEIDSDEYHHDRLLSDLIEIAYLDADNVRSLPSSFEDNKVFDRYYLELQQINGQLTSDIERNVAQKQVILLDPNEIQAGDGYLYPLPDIILDQIDDSGDHAYTIEQIDSDYSNVMSESEDDIQSVIEVNLNSKYDGEIITTLDMRSDIDEMIEVTLWDLKDDQMKEISSKESSVEIISTDNDDVIEHLQEPSDENSPKLDRTPEKNEVPKITELTLNATASSNNLNSSTTSIMYDLPDNVNFKTKEEEALNKDLIQTAYCEIQTLDNEIANNSLNDSGTIKNSEENSKISKISLQVQTDDASSHMGDQNVNHQSSAVIEISRSFIEHEKVPSSAEYDKSSLLISDTVETSKNTNKIPKKVTSNENVDDLIKEGCMGVWFHK